MNRPPEKGEFIDLIRERDKQTGLTFAVLPSLAMVARERRHWRQAAREHSPESLVGVMATQLTRHLNDLVVGRDAAVLAAARLPIIVGEASDIISKWYSQAAVVMPYSTFLRTEVTGLMEDPSGRDDDEQRFFPDYYDHELDKSGMHIADEIIGQVEGVQPQRVGQEVWYEGETVYLRVRKPAEPTILFAEAFRAKGRRLDRTAYASVSPRMKTAAWLE